MAVTLAAIFAWLAWQQRSGRAESLDLALLVLGAGVLGARVGHLLVNWEYYAERWPSILDLRDGGLSWHGGLVAGLLAVALAAVWQHNDAVPYGARLRPKLATLVVPLGIGLLGGWLACLLAGCAYGLPIAPPQRFYTPDWPDSYGVMDFRLPSQLLGILLALCVLFLAKPLMRRPGLLLILLGLGGFLIGWTRGDLPVSWGPLRATQWIDLLLVLAGLLLEAGSRQGTNQDGAAKLIE